MTSKRCTSRLHTPAPPIRRYWCARFVRAAATSCVNATPSNAQGLQLCGIDEPTLVMACSFILSQYPPEPGDVDVLVNCEFTTRPRYGDGGAVLAGDWVLNAATNPPTLRIVGALCDFITREPTADVDVLFGCPAPLMAAPRRVPAALTLCVILSLR